MRFKYILAFTLLSVHLHGANLAEILIKLEDSKRYQAIEHEADADIFQSDASVSYIAPEISLGVSHAKDPLQSDVGYSVALSQNIMQPFSAGSKRSANEYAKRSISQEAKHKKHLLRLDVAYKYHKSCLYQSMKEEMQRLYEEEKSGFARLQKSYEAGEISKKELLFFELELVKLHQEQISLESASASAYSLLKESVALAEAEVLACDDLVELKDEMNFGALDEHSEVLRIEYDIRSAAASYESAQAAIESLSYEIYHSKELDTTVSGLSVSIPIIPLTSKNSFEAQSKRSRVMQLHAQKELLRHQIIKQEQKRLAQIKGLYGSIEITQKEVIPLAQKLMEISKRALQEGEASIIEHLDATRSYKRAKLELLGLQESYYYELFELYKEADIELGEER